MTDMPERIAAWRFHHNKADEFVHGGWSEDHDHKTTEYIRADLVAPNFPPKQTMSAEYGKR